MGSAAPALRDRAILAAWVAGAVLAALLAWSLTYSPRMGALMGAVNRALAASGEGLRLSEPLPRALQPSGLMGAWYSIEGSDSLFLVFAVMRDGILAPHGAEVSPEGRIERILPIGAHSAQASDRMPAGALRVYSRRIEAAFARAAGGGQR